jgi:hypothetical protein
LTLRDCETILFGIITFFNLHLDEGMIQIDIENTFNSISQVVIFKELQGAMELFAIIVPFTRLFYGAHSFFYY